jgi:hypothetical protein
LGVPRSLAITLLKVRQSRRDEIAACRSRPLFILTTPLTGPAIRFKSSWAAVRQQILTRGQAEQGHRAVVPEGSRGKSKASEVVEADRHTNKPITDNHSTNYYLITAHSGLSASIRNASLSPQWHRQAQPPGFRFPSAVP